ncbi:MAG: MFS transporter [Deltaproteobacteria bacterium]|nr:MFS transporter [Deltaproteobacteria bacterium]
MAGNAKFKGWTILICCFICMFFIQGGIQAFAVFLPAIIRDTGFTLGQVALISTIATVVAFAANMSFGSLLKRFSAKTLLFTGAFLCVGNLLIISQAQSLAGLYAGAACAGLAIGLGTVAPISVIMTNWFVKNRATYLSLVIAGSMFGGAVIMPVSGQLIHHFDWRTAYQILGLAIGAVSFTTILVFLTDHPAKKGQKAYGAEDEPESLEQSKSEPGVSEPAKPDLAKSEPASSDPSAVKSDAPTKVVISGALEVKKSQGVDLATARKTPSFWLLLVGILLVGCSTNIENFLPDFWQRGGMSVPTSTAIMGLYALLTGVCSIMLGRVSDKLGGKAYISLTTVSFIIGAFLVFLVGASATYIVVLAIVPFAIGAKKTSTLTAPLVVAEAFGRQHYGAIIGYFAGVLQLGIALSNPIIGALFRVSGGYKLPFTVMGCLSVVAFLLIIVAIKKAPYQPNAQK